MENTDHYRSLERMYLSGPINEIYTPKIKVEKGACVVEIDVEGKYFHSAGSVHGSVYFKMLDDAAFFAASSLEKKVFVLTSSFNIYLLRPISDGIMRSTGRVVTHSKTQFIAESILSDARDR